MTVWTVCTNILQVMLLIFESGFNCSSQKSQRFTNMSMKLMSLCGTSQPQMSSHYNHLNRVATVGMFFLWEKLGDWYGLRERGVWKNKKLFEKVLRISGWSQDLHFNKTKTRSIAQRKHRSDLCESQPNFKTTVLSCFFIEPGSASVFYATKLPKERCTEPTGSLQMELIQVIIQFSE